MQFQTDQSLLFLPLYLQKELDEENTETQADNMQEFVPAQLYNEQVMRIFPKEIAVRFKMLPSFEETFIKINT